MGLGIDMGSNGNLAVFAWGQRNILYDHHGDLQHSKSDTWPMSVIVLFWAQNYGCCIRVF